MSNCFDFPLPWMGLVFSLAKERLRAQLVEKQCPLVEDQATLQETITRANIDSLSLSHFLSYSEFSEGRLRSPEEREVWT